MGPVKVACNTTLGAVAVMCGGTLLNGDPSMEIASVTSDSRDAEAASLFVPLIGERFDGHDFISDLAENRKIAAFLTMKKEHGRIAERHGVGAVLCGDSLSALGAMGAARRNESHACVIGITGTNGKTTTKELVHAIISSMYSCMCNDKNYNNEIGVPFTLLRLQDEHEYAVIEMGMNHSGELARLSAITRPDMAVITNVGEGHLEFLGDIENVAYAKSEIMSAMEPGSVVFINRDTECFDLLVEQSQKAELQVKTFGLRDNADFYPGRYALKEDHINIVFRGQELEIPLYGMHNVYNITAALAVSMEVGIDMPAVMDSLENFKNADGRSRVIDRGYIVIDDTYNANPLSTRYALRSACEIFRDRKKIAVLSDMRELGKHADSFHREIGKDVARYGFKSLYVWGDYAAQYRDGAVAAGLPEQSVRSFDTKQDLSGMLKKELDENTLVLVKGSRSMRMEDIVRDITE